MAPFYLATPRASLVDLHKYAAGSLRRHRSSTYHRSPRVVLPLRCWANTPPTTNSTSSAGSNAQEDATASPPDDGDSPTSLYLRHQLRVTREQYALLVQRCPDVAAADLDACVKPSVELLVKLAGAQAVQRMLISTPLLLVCSLVDWYDFLVDGYGLSKAHFARTLDTHPQLVLHGSLYNAGQVILYLQSLGLTSRDVVASVVPRLPLLLNADTEAQLRPVVDYLRLLGVNDAGIQQLVTRCPSALLLSVKDDLEPRMELLRSAAGLTHAELAQLLNDNVSVAACSAAALTARIDFLRSRCGLSGRHLTTALLRCSELFSVSLANMERKWAFLSAAVGAAAAAASLATYPRYLTHSLIHQIGPRLRFAERHGVVGAFVAASAEAPLNAVADGDCCEATTTAVVSSGTTASGGTVLELRRLLDCSDAEFVERLMPHLPPGTAAAAAVAAGGDDGGDTHPEMTAELLLQSYSLFAAQWEGEEGLLWAGTNAPFA